MPDYDVHEAFHEMLEVRCPGGFIVALKKNAFSLLLSYKIQKIQMHGYAVHETYSNCKNGHWVRRLGPK